ncbi:MAG: hypothetical protein M1608_07055 [Candidatus Omnitrophica bacterium]|nr:hypothetical protein [Candidatus Omnitrophota bacterium]
MFWLKIFVFAAAMLGVLPSALADTTNSTPQATTNEFRLINGDIIRGELASATEDGLVAKLDVGGFSDRVPWAKFTQDTLKQLATLPNVKPFVDPFIEIPPEVKARKRAQRKVFHAQPPVRVPLPDGGRGLVAVISTPIGLGMIGALFLINLYAAYEIALYRNRPAPLVCGVSVLLPVLGPILFLSLPGEQVEAADTVEEVEEEQVAERLMTRSDIGYAALQPTASGNKLSMAKGDKGSGNSLQAAVYTRGEFTFNRRFFETKFPGFFRIVPGEAEKDMVLVIGVVRGEYVARRIARITSSEMHVQLLKGGPQEVGVNFGEITRVEVRHKDAKA